jgi:hypothetical protein
MQVEVSRSGRRVIDESLTGMINVDLYDSVIAEVAEVDVDFGKADAEYEIDSARVLVSSFGTKYGVRVVLKRKEPK